MKYFVYGFFILAFLFAGGTAYLFFLGSSGGEQKGYGVDSSDSRFGSTVLKSQSRPVSGKGGTLLITYSGDIKGSLLPCG